jgi:hypothetical protein
MQSRSGGMRQSTQGFLGNVARQTCLVAAPTSAVFIH